MAGELEARWEEALQQRDQLQRDRAEFERQEPPTIGDSDRERIKALSSDLGQVWHADTTSMEDRKTLLRFLAKRVHLDGVTEKGKIRIDIEWHTGAHTTTTINRPLVGVWAPKTPSEAVEHIRELLDGHDYATIAIQLNKAGFRTAKSPPFYHNSAR